MKTKYLLKWYDTIKWITATYTLMQLIISVAVLKSTDFSETGFIELMQKNIHTLTSILVSTLFFMLVHNAKKGEIFTKKNEMLLLIFGRIIGLTGVFLWCLDRMTSDTFSGVILSILIGLMLVFFAKILKIGRNTSEEQELTI